MDALSSLDSCIEAQQFSRAMLEALFVRTREMEAMVEAGRSRAGAGDAQPHPWRDALAGKVMATIFYEPSTRTRLSFETAMCRLGGRVVSTENAREFSSVAKGETLQDTVRTLEQYVDLIVLRHFQAGSARLAAAAASVPVINAGDGAGQHPTQALLDLYTIHKELGYVAGAEVALVGDLAYGRTARSLAYMLAKFDGVKLFFVAPPVARMQDDIKAYLDQQGTHWCEVDDLKEVAGRVDVLYQTRIQKERYLDRPEAYDDARAGGAFAVDGALMRDMRPGAVLMHPLPRVDEIAEEVDDDPRAAYFRQARNGLYVRMALLHALLTE